jgi:hypothetical protein
LTENKTKIENQTKFTVEWFGPNYEEKGKKSLALK